MKSLLFLERANVYGRQVVPKISVDKFKILTIYSFIWIRVEQSDFMSEISMKPYE